MRYTLITLFLLMTGCANYGSQPPAMANQCENAALAKFAQAEQQSRSGQHAIAARHLQSCMHEAAIPNEQSLRYTALIITGLIKAGEVEEAQSVFDELESNTRQDLYLADGSSLIDSLGLILASERSSRYRRNPLPLIESETNRTHYWQTH